MVGKKEKKTEYITPYKDSGIGYIVNLKVLGVLWTLMLFLKVLCHDEEWSFFLMFTALLLLFLLPFFITKEVAAIATDVDVDSTSMLILPAC